MRQMIFHDKNVYDTFIDHHHTRLNKMKSKNLQRLLSKECVIVEFQNIVREDICSTLYEVYGMWEHFPRSLDEEIRDRNIRNKQFTEK